MPGEEQGSGTADPDWRGRLRSWASDCAVAAFRGLALCGLPLAATGLALVLAAPLALAGLGAGFVLNPPPWMSPTLQTLPFVGLVVSLALFPAAAVGVRRLANRARRLAGAWCSTPVAEPYRPAPNGSAGRRARLGWMLADPATRRPGATSHGLL